MELNSYKTVHANAKTVTKNWVIVDAKDQILGRFPHNLKTVDIKEWDLKGNVQAYEAKRARVLKS